MCYYVMRFTLFLGSQKGLKKCFKKCMNRSRFLCTLNMSLKIKYLILTNIGTYLVFIIILLSNAKLKLPKLHKILYGHFQAALENKNTIFSEGLK